MLFELKIIVGTQEVTIREETENHAKFFEKIAFFSSLPKTGPTGSKNLRFSHRRTKEGYDYYSIIDDDAKQELKFGQSKDAPGTLFTKGWEPAYTPDDSSETVVSAPAGLGNTDTAKAVPTTPTVQAAPVNTVKTAPVTAPVVPVVLGVQAILPPLTPVVPAAPALTPAAPANAAVQNVLEKYGLNK